jgi:hypothetical protein
MKRAMSYGFHLNRHSGILHEKHLIVFQLSLFFTLCPKYGTTRLICLPAYFPTFAA